MAAAGLRIAPRQRDVDRAELVDLKALADRLHPAKTFEQLAQSSGRDVKDLEIDVGVGFAGAVHDPTAAPAADDHPPAAGAGDGARDVDGSINRGIHVARPELVEGRA